MDITTFLSRAEKMIKKAISAEVDKVFKEEVAPVIVQNLMSAYDEVLASKEPGYDPAKPSEARQAFEMSLINSITSTYEHYDIGVSFSTGDKSQLGYDNHTLSHLKGGVPKNPNPLEWLIFYLEGFIGDFFFIDEDDFKALVDAGVKTAASLEKFKSWGWYGQGFLIPRKEFIARKFASVPGVKSKRHPFSGLQKQDIFERALDGVDIIKVFDLAIERATEKV